MIVSTVRTTGPGFLRSLNRMNVMLTRCKAGMVVVTSRRFLNEGGRDTLLGKLARRWNGSSEAWVNAVELSGKGADLPGPFNCAGQAAVRFHHVGGSLGTDVRAPVEGSIGQGLPGRVVPGWMPPDAQKISEPKRSGTRKTQLSPPTTVCITPHVLTSVSQRSPSLSSFNTAPHAASSVYKPVFAGNSGVSAGLGKRLGTMSLDDTVAEDPFPTLGTVSSKQVGAAVQGRWRKGSEACKL